MNDPSGPGPASPSDTAHRRFSRRTVAGALALGVAGVGGAVALGRREGGSPGNGRTPVTVWAWLQDQVQALDEIASAFNASQDTIAVEVVPRIAANVTAQLVNTIRNEVGPDLSVSGRGLLAEWNAIGITQAITADLDAAGIDLDRDYHPFAVEDVRLHGRDGAIVVGLPLDVMVRVLMVNRGILKEAGVDTAEWDPAHGPVTFDRLAEVAHSLDRTDAEGKLERVGFVPVYGEGSAYQYLHSWGARYFDEAGCAFTVDTPEAQAAARWVQDDVQRTGAEALGALLQTDSGISLPAATPFLRGHVVFALAGDRELREVAKVAPDLDLGATVLPTATPSTPSRPWATGTALTLMSGTKHRAEALRFLAYLAQEDVLGRYCLRLGALSSRKTVTPELKAGLALPDFVIDTALPAGVPTPHVPIASAFADLLSSAWFGMAMGTTEVATGLTTLQEDATRALAESEAGQCA